MVVCDGVWSFVMVCDCDLVCLRGRLLGCRLCICQCVRAFVRSGFLRTFWELSATFGEAWGPLGLHSRSSGGRVGTILGSLGISWASSGRLWGSLGRHSGVSWAPQGALGGSLGALGSHGASQAKEQGTGKFATPPTFDFGALASTGC